MDKIEKVKGWIARDDDGTLAIHYEKPRRVCYQNGNIMPDGTPWVWENEAGYGLLPVKIFPDLKWEDEPIEVELTIKRVSTLSEEPDKNLEEAAEKYLNKVFGDGKHQQFYKDLFIAGWKCRDDQMPMPEDTVLFQKGVAEGRRLEREDVLGDVVEGYVDKDYIVTEGPFYFIRSKNIDLPNVYKEGDKVRIIMLKDEE